MVGRCLVGAVLAALGFTGCGSTASTTSSTTTTVVQATPAQQMAARTATEGFRALVTQAGQRLGAALDQHPPDVGSARLALDQIRAVLPQDPQGSSQLDLQLLDAEDPSVLVKLRSSLTGISLLLSQVVRDPSAIAVVAREEIEWVESRAPEVFDEQSPFTLEDLKVMVDAAHMVVATTGQLGTLVDPQGLALVDTDLSRLSNLLDSGAPLRQTIEQADASLRSLSLYQESLVDFGTASVDP